MLIFMRTYDLVQIYFEMKENAFFVFYQIKQIPIQYARDSCWNFQLNSLCVWACVYVYV